MGTGVKLALGGCIGLILLGLLTVVGCFALKSRRTIKLTDQAIEALKSRRARQNEERLRLGSL